MILDFFKSYQGYHCYQNYGGFQKSWCIRHFQKLPSINECSGDNWTHTEVTLVTNITKISQDFFQKKLWHVSNHYWENHSLCWIQCIWWAFSSLVKLVVLFGRLVGRLAGSCTISIPEAGAMYNCTCLRFEGLFAVPVLYQKIQKPIGPRVDWHKWGKVGAPHSECVITSDWFRPPPPLLRLAPTYPPPTLRLSASSYMLA